MPRTLAKLSEAKRSEAERSEALKARSSIIDYDQDSAQFRNSSRRSGDKPYALATPII